MSNLIPPLLSDSPPPIVGPLDEDDDDEFGDFRVAAAVTTDSYDCDDFSLPPSPHKSPEKMMIKNEEKPTVLDINSNNNQETIIDKTDLSEAIVICDSNEKDFQDKRKTDEDDVNSDDDFEVNSSNSLTNDDLSTFNEYIDDNVEENGPNIDDHDDLNMENCDNSNNKLELLESDEIGNKTIEIDTNFVENNDDDDDFGGFETDFHKNDIEDDTSQSDNLTKIDNSNDSQLIQSEINDDDEQYDDDFTDFQTIEAEIKDDDQSVECDIKNTSDSESFANFQTNNINDDDNFADFQKKPFEIKSNTEDQHDDFGDFEAPPPIQQNSNEPETVNKNDDDDFAEFTSNQPVLLLDSNDVLNKCGTIVKEIFPKIDDDIDDFRCIDDTENDQLFNSLKDITETNAINYQWSKSNCQKVLLKSLNIDMRNILYGPGWSSSMPRFAANLGVTPLEPIKTTEILTPTPVLQPNQSSPSSVDSCQKDPVNNVDIPNVQFDWNDSGLINPLDSTPSKKEETPRHIEALSQDQEKSDLFLTNITEKLKNLSTTTTIIAEDNDIKIKDLESPKMIPLRETHISNDNNISLEKPDWFQSTIQTPELPRKIDFINDDDDDDFDDFQMVLPVTKTATTTPVIENVNLHIINNSNDQPVEETIKIENNNSNNDDDDEFTDFHSTLPTVLQPVPLEPLKPSIINPVSSTAAQINWPEPGVSDEEIRNIELSYSRNTIEDNKSNSLMLAKDNELFRTVPQQQQQQLGNNNCVSRVDDDEWSDFVSVVPSTPKSTTTERTATPDLPLSVLNLNCIQAARPPIPVLTPNGLVQTKLSINVDNAPKSTNIVQTKISTNYQQPTLITNQFNNLQNPTIHSANFNLLTPIKPTPIQTNFNQTTSPLTQFNDKNGGGDNDDEDWSDFVSSQPTVNGHQMRMNQNKTNITTNPNFDTFKNYNTNQIRKNSFVNGQQRSNNGLSNIATIPDLDFIAPKNRTSKK